METKFKILLAEDKFLNQKLFTFMLERYNCNIDVANNGKEVLKKYEDFKYDIILLDIKMPIMDGIETIQKLKKLSSNLPPIIALSGENVAREIQTYSEHGFDDVLEKPVNDNQIHKIIQKWCMNTTAESPIDKSFISSRLDKLPIVNQETFDFIVKQAKEHDDDLKSIFEIFFSDTEELIKTAKNALHKNNYREFSNCIHDIKGMSGFIGASKLFNLTKKIYNLTNATHLNKFDTLLDEVSELFNEFKTHILQKIKYIT